MDEKKRTYPGGEGGLADDPLARDLATHLEALRRDDCYRVERTLRKSETEETQLVWFKGANGSEQGPYVRKYLARGTGMGEVWRKLYDAESSGRRFRSLPRVLDCYDAGDRLAVVIEYVNGVTLRELFLAAMPEECLELTRCVFPAVCDAVSELHGAFDPPVIHRDITPGNIVCSSGRPLSISIIDLGIARVYKSDAAADTTHFGTRPYAPPEQYGFGQTDVRTDVYALGMLLMFCLTGEDPDPAERKSGFIRAKVHPVLRSVICTATAFGPEARPASVQALKELFLNGAKRLVRTPEQRAESLRLARERKAARLELQKQREAEREAARLEALKAAQEADSAGDALGRVGEQDSARLADGPRLWTARNVIVALLAVMLVAVSASCALDSTRWSADEPAFVNLFGYLFFMPVLILDLAWCLMDRRWICGHVPSLRETAKGQQLRAAALVAILDLALLVVVIALATPFGGVS